jgi:hypothetical protein
MLLANAARFNPSSSEIGGVQASQAPGFFNIHLQRPTLALRYIGLADHGRDQAR